MTENRMFWPTTTIGNLVDRGILQAIVGFPFGGHGISSDGVPHVRPFNVSPLGEIDLSEVKQIPHTAAAGRPQLRRGDILFNNTNTKELVGKCALWDREEQYPFSNHMTRIRVLQPEADPAFLSFAILAHWMSGRSQMLARAHVAQASIMGERLREIAIPWPPPARQREMAQALSLVQAAGHAHWEIAIAATRLKQTAMRELFTRGLRGEAQKETEIGLVPESWDVVTLGSLGRVGNGSTPKKSIPGYWQGGTYPWLTSAKVYDREIVSADHFVTEQALRECHLPRIDPGAILIAITGQGKTLGHCAVLGIQATINQHLAYVALDVSRADPLFVRGYLETRYEYLRQVGSAGGSTKGALTCAFLRAMPIPFPSLEEQREISAVLSAIDRKIDLHKRKRAVLEDLFKALLHKLMTGEVRVQGLDLSTLASVKREAAA